MVRADIQKILASWSKIDKNEARRLSGSVLYPKLERLAGDEELVWLQGFTKTSNPHKVTVANSEGGVLAVTDTRLLFVSNDGSGQWPLSGFHSVSIGHAPAIKVLTLSGYAGELHFFAGAQEIIEPLGEFIGTAIKDAAVGHVPPAAASGADELAKFAALRDSGVVTAAEFERKKREILGF
jgi:hypothetical protein